VTLHYCARGLVAVVLLVW